MLATVASMTSANRLSRYCASRNIASRVVQTPAHLTREGCGYSVMFDDIYRGEISRFAAENKIKIRAFYSTRTDGGKTVYEKVQP